MLARVLAPPLLTASKYIVYLSVSHCAGRGNKISSGTYCGLCQGEDYCLECNDCSYHYELCGTCVRCKVSCCICGSGDDNTPTSTPTSTPTPSTGNQCTHSNTTDEIVDSNADCAIEGHHGVVEYVVRCNDCGNIIGEGWSCGCSYV